MHHQNAGAPGGEHTGHHLGRITECATDQSGAWTCRIGKRPKQIEDRWHSDLPPWRARVPKRGMEHRGEAEPDTHLGHTAGHLIGAQVDPDSQCLEHVGAATRRRRGPVAVFDHRHTGGRHHDRGHRRDVHGVGAIAAGANDVDGVCTDDIGGHPAGVAQHGVCQLADLGGGGALHLHRHAEGGDLRGCRVAGHDLVHRPLGLPRLEFRTCGQPAQDLRPRGLRGVRARPV